MPEHRKNNRRKVNYYMPVVDVNSGEIFGHLNDISPQGLMIDTKHKLTNSSVYHLSMETSADIASTPSIDFKVRVKWSQNDWIQPFIFNVGMEIVEISPQASEVLKNIQEKYGA